MCAAINKRVSSLAQNVSVLAPLMKGHLSSLSYILKTRGQPDVKQRVSYNGIEFDFRRSDLPAIKEILYAGEYDFLSDIITSKDAPYVYDLGAHIGLFAIRVLALNPSAKILSLEASPRNYDVIARNVEINKNTYPNWVLKHAAAWKNNDVIKFQGALESTMSHRVDSEGSVEVPGITFKQLLEMHSKDQRIDIMKIDIEGAEEAFLCDGDVDLSNVQNLIIEIHPNYCDGGRVRALLEKHFTTITEKHDSALSKPLLLCQK